MYLCITNAFYGKNGFKRRSVYDCTRKYWNLRSLNKASQAEFIVGLANGEIKGIFTKTDNWKLVKDMPELLNDEEVSKNPEYKLRYAFSGSTIDLNSSDGKKIIEYYREHPFKFHGNVEQYNF